MSPEQSAAVAARLRDAADSIRRKPTPLADLIPLLQQAADALDEAQQPPTDAQIEAALEAWFTTDRSMPTRMRAAIDAARAGDAA